MQGRSLITSTGMPVEHSGGAYPTFFTNFLDPEHQTNLPALEFITLDEGEHGDALFHTTVQVTSASPLDLSETAICRMACLYMLGRLAPSSLREACELLVDIYEWQIKRPGEVASRNWDHIDTSPTVVSVPRQPFVVEDN